ncbi:hypothetical protein FWD07_00825 [Candidatus Saccharibacteria bacterium]|nr:hypothetical protein [Candidatus Saccharibacteria bacterium]
MKKKTLANKNKTAIHHDIVLYATLALVSIATLVIAALILFFDHVVTARFYDYIVLLAGIVALILAVISSLDAKKQRLATQRIQYEIHDAIRELRDINKENESIRRAVSDTNKVTHQVLADVEKLEVN